MFSTDRALGRPLLTLSLLVLVALGPHVSTFADAERPGETEPQIWLVTYGPGPVYWQRFGHNALWVRDEHLGLDHAFNFGFFDFLQESFFRRFLLGRMLYFSAARPVQTEFSSYMAENRSIRAQRLELPVEQKLGLIDFLLEEVQPENRDYLYDYYRNNCSTRIRDALDLALHGALSERFGSKPAPQSFRDHTRRLSHGDFWLYLGLELVLGAPIDRPISRWEEMFIPAELAAAVSELRSGDSSAEPLVIEEAVIFESSLPPPPLRPASWWPSYLVASLGLLLAAWLLSRLGPDWIASLLARGWLMLAGVAGACMLFFWVGTDHWAAQSNLNLLVFNPLWTLFALCRTRCVAAGLIILLGSLAALPMPFLPPGQYTLDVLAAFLPLNLAAASNLLQSGFGRRTQDAPIAES